MVAILILAHKNLKQVQRLIDTLVDKDVKIYVHIDKKCKEDFEIKNAIVLDQRFNLKWAGYSIVTSTIECIRLIKDKYDHLILLSGQDYLIKPVNKLVAFLKKNKNTSFMTYREVSENDWNVSWRYEKYHFKNRYVNYAMNHLLPTRKFIKNHKPYGGSQWWILAHDAVNYILETCDKLHLKNKFKHTSCMDEILFQSLLLNSKFKNNIKNDNLRYIDWSDHINALNNGNPNILKVKDFDNIIKSGKYIARKFDSNIDEEILDMLDEYRK